MPDLRNILSMRSLEYDKTGYLYRHLSDFILTFLKLELGCGFFQSVVDDYYRIDLTYNQ